MCLHLPSLTFILLHLPSFTLITFHSPSSAFIYPQIAFILLHLPSYTLITFHFNYFYFFHEHKIYVQDMTIILRYKVSMYNFGAHGFNVINIDFITRRS